LYFHRPWDAESMFMREFTPQQNHNLSITGGSDKVNYNAGFGLISQTGILKDNPDKYNRYNFNLGINADITDWLTGYVKVLYSSSEVTKPYSFNGDRSEEHTSELQSRENLVCRLLLEKKNKSIA